MSLLCRHSTARVERSEFDSHQPWQEWAGRWETLLFQESHPRFCIETLPLICKFTHLFRPCLGKVNYHIRSQHGSVEVLALQVAFQRSGEQTAHSIPWQPCTCTATPSPASCQPRESLLCPCSPVLPAWPCKHAVGSNSMSLSATNEDFRDQVVCPFCGAGNQKFLSTIFTSQSRKKEHRFMCMSGGRDRAPCMRWQPWMLPTTTWAVQCPEAGVHPNLSSSLKVWGAGIPLKQPVLVVMSSLLDSLLLLLLLS